MINKEYTKLKEKVPKEKQMEFELEEQKTTRFINCFFMVLNLLYQIYNIRFYMNKYDGEIDKTIVLLIYWIPWTLAFIVFIWSYKTNKKILFIALGLIMIVRNMIPFFDLEGKRFNMSSAEINFFCIIQCFCVFFLMQVNTLLMSRGASILIIAISLIFMAVGIIRFNIKDANFVEAVQNEHVELIKFVVMILIGYLAVYVYMYFYIIANIKHLQSSLFIEYEANKILQMLDEAIIIKSKNGIRYNNQKGFDILQTSHKLYIEQ